MTAKKAKDADVLITVVMEVQVQSKYLADTVEEMEQAGCNYGQVLRLEAINVPSTINYLL